MNNFHLMHELPFLVGSIPKIWYALPLVIVVSLVYGATRHENLPDIIEHSIRSAVWVVCFMSIIFFLIWFAGFWT